MPGLGTGRLHPQSSPRLGPTLVLHITQLRDQGAVRRAALVRDHIRAGQRAAVFCRGGAGRRILDGVLYGRGAVPTGSTAKAALTLRTVASASSPASTDKRRLDNK